MKKNSAKMMALGGIFAALAVIVMCLGGLIPIAVYICPLVCMLLGSVILKKCGSRIAWAWYGAVAVLALLLGPDKEAAFVYVFLGYYPILKSWFDKTRFGFLWKLAYFNSAILLMYMMLLYLMGMVQLAQEYAEIGAIGLVVLLLLGNLTFLLFDRLLTRMENRK